ncbi:hypothetical protein [Variovorax sp. Sphag1AA]|uniref:hypothetical protein n=1 Tax=Variovorax sp. Sphag1AA TaxID=2587027 RepID=UPI00160CE0F8|nr:hypothetical protein [Variovorax sp. Sphag1AA]MBB3176027.1 hypothetical protein [Variovorax sp. Sphag1AA]
MTRRHSVLAMAFIATLLAVYFAPPEADEVVQASPSANVAVARPGTRPAASDVLALRPRDPVGENDSSLFAVRSWDAPASEGRPAPLPDASSEAEPPQVPSVPLQLIGRYQENGRIAMFGTFNGDSVVLWPGEKINAEWRVDAIEAGQVVLTYLPLGQQKSLPWTATR